MKYDQQNGNPQLIQKLRDEMSQSKDGTISFAQFMGLCLYDPEHGYYTNHRLKIGKDGDFYTSSSVGTIMGEMLAKYCAGLIEEQFTYEQQIQLVEWGGGNGQLAKHMLDELKAVYPEAYARIVLICVEESLFHRKLQKEALSKHIEQVQWLSAEQWFEQGEKAATIIFSNELLDAFPVHRIACVQGLLYEIMVSWSKERAHFEEKLVPLEDERLLHYIEDESIALIDGQRIEINLEAVKWIETLGAWLQKGVLITIDYGDEAREIYADHRMNGTLMCYRNHQAYDNPYIYVGEQDITSHVNFSSCIHAGLRAGFSNWSYVDQKTFLINAGIMEKLKDHSISDPFHPQAKINRTIRQILWSDQMSELFKVLVQIK